MSKKLRTIAGSIGIVLLLIIVIGNVVFYDKIDDHEHITFHVFIGLKLLITLIIASVLYLIANINFEKHPKIKYTIMVITIIFYEIASFVYIYYRKSSPAWDQSNTYWASKMIYRGKDIFLKDTNYFAKYPQQFPLAFLWSILFHIFKNEDFIIIQYFNVIFNVISLFALLKITKILSEDYEVNEKLTFVIFIAFFPLALLSIFVYGDLSGLTMSLLSILFIMKWGKEESYGKKTIFLIISGIFMSFGYMLRMNNLIFIIAITIYILLVLMNMKDKKELLLGIISLIVFLELAIIPANTIKNYYSNKLSFKKESIYPVTGFLYMGMMESSRANGWYNDKYSQYGLNSDDAGPLYKDLIKERVQEFLKDPIWAIKFYAKKTYSMWCENTYQSVYHNRNIYSNVYHLKTAPKEYDAFFSKYEIPIIVFSKAVSLLIFGFALIATLKNREDLSNEFVLLLTVFIGGFLFHTIWEAKSRYILSYVVILIPLASIVVLPKLNFLKKNKEESNGD